MAEATLQELQQELQQINEQRQEVICQHSRQSPYAVCTQCYLHWVHGPACA